MDWCVKFPKESMLILRPSLRRACGENRNAAKLLSYLLFCANSQEVQINAQLKRYIAIYRTQGQIADDIDNELSTRTLRDEAIPCLVDLGYLSVEEVKGDKQYTIYHIYPDAIQNGLDQPVTHYKDLPYYKNKAVRKNFRAEKLPNSSEIIPNGQEKTPSLHAQGLGNFSEPKNTDETASQASVKTEIAPPKKGREINTKINTEREAIHSSNESQELGQPRQRIPYFIKDMVRRNACALGESQKVEEYTKCICEIYQTSGKQRDDFESIIRRVEKEVYNMPDFVIHVRKLAGVKVCDPVEQQPITMEVYA